MPWDTSARSCAAVVETRPVLRAYSKSIRRRARPPRLQGCWPCRRALGTAAGRPPRGPLGRDEWSHPFAVQLPPLPLHVVARRPLGAAGVEPREERVGLPCSRAGPEKGHNEFHELERGCNFSEKTFNDRLVPAGPVGFETWPSPSQWSARRRGCCSMRVGTAAALLVHDQPGRTDHGRPRSNGLDPHACMVRSVSFPQSQDMFKTSPAISGKRRCYFNSVPTSSDRREVPRPSADLAVPYGPSLARAAGRSSTVASWSAAGTSPWASVMSMACMPARLGPW